MSQVDAILFATLTTSYHVAVNLCLVKLYFNSLLVSCEYSASEEVIEPPLTQMAVNARADLEKHVRGVSNLSPHIMVTSESETSDEAGNWWGK